VLAICIVLGGGLIPEKPDEHLVIQKTDKITIRMAPTKYCKLNL
jgi:hypothetical protein